MRTLSRISGSILLLLVGVADSQGQSPQWDATFGGESFLAPNTGNPAAPFNVTIGDAATTTATLSVRGDQLPVPDPFFGGPRLCTFRTDVAALREQSWWMYRDANHIGRIWADGGHRAFHFQNMELADIGMDRYSGAMVEPPERRIVGRAGSNYCYHFMKLSTTRAIP